MSLMYRVRTSITGSPGGAELSTMFFDASTGTRQDAADAVRAFWLTLAGRIKSGVTATVEPDVYTVDAATGHATASGTTSTAAVLGTASGELLPNASQGLARWHTGVFISGRELQGRTFIPGAVTGDNVAGAPGPTYKTTLQTAITNLSSSGPITFGIYSRKNGVFYEATSGSPWTQWAVLRSRRS